MFKYPHPKGILVFLKAYRSLDDRRKSVLTRFLRREQQNRCLLRSIDISLPHGRKFGLKPPCLFGKLQCNLELITYKDQCSCSKKVMLFQSWETDFKG